ncbi:MAG TPA: hypothetical protein VJT09_07055 [Pyrinomonadaceae bacterium]|nr:hypothetical protein [Pyrinomonadaceae bacterium]
MSYHILHQFDEQWLVDLKQDAGGSKHIDFTDASSPDERRPARRSRLVAREGQRWAVISLSILIATFALLFAVDATNRAEALQQRLDVLEKKVK